MNRYEATFAAMRRWTAINKCLEVFSDKEKAALVNFFNRKTLAERAKEYGATQARMRQIDERLLKILADMLYDGEPLDAGQ